MSESAAIIPSKADSEARKRTTAIIEFPQGEGSLVERAVTARRGQAAEDVLIGNKQHLPFAVVLPVRHAIPGTTLAAPEIEHVVVFQRGHISTVGLQAMHLWEQHCRVPEFPGSEYPAVENGELVVVRLDDGDMHEYWKDACKRYKADEHRNPLVAFGSSRSPYAFCSPKTKYDITSLGSENSSGVLSVGKMAGNIFQP
jgi:hypothetical protein